MIMRAPKNDPGESLDQLIRRQHLALVVEHEGRQAKRGQCRARSTRAFELQTRCRKGAAGDMRAQRIELLDGIGLHRSACLLSLERDEDTVVRRQDEGRRGGVAKAARVNVVPIQRIRSQLVIGIDVHLAQKARMVRCNQFRESL